MSPRWDVGHGRWLTVSQYFQEVDVLWLNRDSGVGHSDHTAPLAYLCALLLDECWFLGEVKVIFTTMARGMESCYDMRFLLIDCNASVVESINKVALNGVTWASTRQFVGSPSCVSTCWGCCCQCWASYNLVYFSASCSGYHRVFQSKRVSGCFVFGAGFTSIPALVNCSW